MVFPKMFIKALGYVGVLTACLASSLYVSPFPKKGEAVSDPHPPRMLASLGCDGSTAILEHAYMILPMHGVNPGRVDSQKELLDPKRNPFIGVRNQDIMVAMQLLHKQREERGETLVFKSIFGRDHDATLDRRLADLGTLALVSTRRNVLDKLVCMVRDCFLDEWFRDDVNLEDSKYGYPVNYAGNLDRLCFRRRDSDSKNTSKAVLVSSELASNLDWLISQDDNAVEELNQAGYDAPRVLYEDMLGFEEDAQRIPNAVEAWSAALKAWGVEPSQSKLEAYFSQQAGNRPPMKPHSEMIHNIEEVKAELKKTGRMDLYRS